METVHTPETEIGLKYIAGASLFLYILGLFLSFLVRTPYPGFLQIFIPLGVDMTSDFYSDIFVYNALMLIMLFVVMLWLKDYLGTKNLKLMIGFSVISMSRYGMWCIMLLVYPDENLFVVYIPLFILQFAIGMYWIYWIHRELISHVFGFDELQRDPDPDEILRDMFRTGHQLLAFGIALLIIGVICLVVLWEYIAPGASLTMLAFAGISLYFSWFFIKLSREC